MNGNDIVRTELLAVAKAFSAFAQEQAEMVARAAALCVDSLRQGGKILFCGNGGSAADAQHLAAELVGRYQRERRALAAVALTTDTSVLTSIANDYDYDSVFARQVEGLGRNGDVLIGISTSGNSKNVLRALACAKANGLKTVAFTGGTGGEMSKLADVAVIAPSSVTCHIQEMHIAAGHQICGLVEAALAADGE